MNRVLLGWRGPTLVQYWRSTEDVYSYASDRDARHRPAWAAFNRRARRAPGVVGMWHETHQVEPAESVHSTVRISAQKQTLAAGSGHD